MTQRTVGLFAMTVKALANAVDREKQPDERIATISSHGNDRYHFALVVYEKEEEQK